MDRFTEVSDINIETTESECLPSCPKIGGLDDSVLGVRYLWVHMSYRRKNVARNLLDIARKHAIFGRIIDRKNICFSQPTSSGIDFAFSYVKSDHILTYA